MVRDVRTNPSAWRATCGGFTAAGRSVERDLLPQADSAHLSLESVERFVIRSSVVAVHLDLQELVAILPLLEEHEARRIFEILVNEHADACRLRLDASQVRQ